MSFASKNIVGVNDMMKRIISALLSVLLLLSPALLSACGKNSAPAEQAEQTEQENILLSNILFAGMKLSSEEKKLLDGVRELLSEAVLDCTDSSYEKLSLQNTLDTELNIRFLLVHYDENGTIVGSSWLNVTEWAPGVWLNAVVSGGLDRYTPLDHAEIAAQIESGDHYLRTDFVPLQVKKANPVALSLDMELPIQFTIKDRWSGDSTFRLSEMDLKDGYLHILLTKLSGPTAYLETFDYRILDKASSAIVDSGSFSVHYLREGETIRLSDMSLYDLAPGDYRIELLVDDIREVGEGGSTPADSPRQTDPPLMIETPKPTPTPTPEPKDEWKEELDAARELMNDGNYHDAAVKIVVCYNTYPDSQDECLELLSEIKRTLADVEPKTGELERTIVYQGGHEVHITAQSGPVEMTITNVHQPSQYVRFYVRQGETSLIYLVSGTYEVKYKVGLIWFNDTIGFGDLCNEKSYSDYLDVHTTQSGTWVTNYRWSDVI